MAARLQLIRGLAASGDAPGDAARGIDDAAADAGLGDPEGWRFRSASQRTKRLALRDVLQVSDAWHQHGSARSAHAGRCAAELHQAPACARLFPAPPHGKPCLPAMQDAWEFRGLGRLWWFLLYFVYTIVFIGFNWSENAVSTSARCGLTSTPRPT